MSDESKEREIEAIMRVWDGFEFDNSAVMRDSVRALVVAAYNTGYMASARQAEGDGEIEKTTRRKNDDSYRA